MKQLSIGFLALAVACASPTKSDQEIFSGQQREVLDPVKETELEVPLPELEQKLIAQGLMDVATVDPSIRVELKYSTTDNFFGKDVYGDHVRCYLQPEVAEMVKKAQDLLQRDHPHLTLLIYDGVRPLSVQQILWDSLDKPDSIKPLYVADPKVGGLHNFGVAVDLTIFDAQTDSVLDMGTSYDYFGYPAYPDQEKKMLVEGKITQAQVANREILRKIMTDAGFTGIGSEWWHFNAFSRKEAGERFELVE